MTPNNFSTVRDLLRYAVTRFNTEQLFFGHGSSNALDEAAYLILHTLKLPLDQLDPFLDARLLPEEIASVMRVIERRSKDRVPAAYITNEAWLGAYRFYVDERVIVPRSFIAELIPQHFSPWIQDPEAIVNALDLCTGSGCLPILLADAFPNAQIDAVDISADALAVARKNVDEYQLQERINLVESDLYTQLPLRKYDLIISNPPYVNSGSMSKLPQEYLREPQLALAGGEDGMDLVRKIVAGAAERLTPEGVLVVEIGNERAFAEAAFPELELTWLTTSAGDDMVFLVTAEQLQLA
ncbi:50S ribosomal protein L3 N(5)-glutamine methyltransferase [Herbaspirillum sp. WGmk3]|jgi:[LSU ribosomal protein L3P]-glutamine N5-methyltransferase (EC 2.1.1.-)|uniref:Ribosomal protein uL3 glutamine methyltransferase n=3 Tax=Herbaspirillum huttiense TaxID=863372 RepID=A0AAJ2H552_9BURK|nr:MULTISPECIES: 50S ribosomal protein L3 N(5)-glutamine methyltransferase [Herbaspirillum]MBP1313072.1 ribosomal protein L3 glutamine methyltransferase [Herbaspirillum sp. 1130]MCO4856684.1 50S ribosomal protein L3 N(5)-glutamine methyltransferase [Herbaspirillum sp. WGmk3]MDR9834449.1 50S ribosomal protein L3 N(5)-glutamine methyltransferase [Herbaspirillum huttiense]MDR9846778.1 50S ribosomal protein L3 N(5)-glutamine methyltransferase [Herbaspirillum huttiense SE1]MEE1635732.1 50S ribosoma